MAADQTHSDDLERIKGIGETIAARLGAAGIHSFERLGRTPIETLAKVSGQSVKQIERDDWIGRARELTSGSSVDDAPDDDVHPPGRHNFTIALQFDATTGDVLSSAVHHVQSQIKDTWRGWDRDRVALFVEHQAGIESEEDAIPADVEHTHNSERSPTERPAAPAPTTTGQEEAEAKSAPTTGMDRYEPTSVVGFGEISARRLLPPNSGPAVLTVTFVPSDLVALHGVAVSSVEVEVYARRPGSGAARKIGRTQAPVGERDSVQVDVDVSGSHEVSPLELFAVLTFLGRKATGPPVRVNLAAAQLLLRR